MSSETYSLAYLLYEPVHNDSSCPKLDATHKRYSISLETFSGIRVHDIQLLHNGSLMQHDSGFTFQFAFTATLQSNAVLSTDRHSTNSASDWDAKRCLSILVNEERPFVTGIVYNALQRELKRVSH